MVDGLKAVSSASSAESVLEGYNSSHLLGLTLENVNLDATEHERGVRQHRQL